MILLAAVIGLPCVGKSSICEFLSSNIVDYQIIHIQYDLYITDNFLSINELESNQWKLCRNAILDGLELFLDWNINENNNLPLFQQLQTKGDKIKYNIFHFLHNLNLTDKNKRYVILLDDNFFYRSMRYELFKLAKKYSLSFGTIICKCDVNLLLERYINRKNNSVSINSLSRISRLFELPKSTNWEKWIFEINTSFPHATWLPEFQTFLEVCFQNPFDFISEFENIRISPNDSHISPAHKLDTLLRKCVNEIMKNNYVKFNGNKLASFKKMVLDESKNDPIIISKLMYGEDSDTVLEEMKLMFISKLTLLLNS